MTLLPGLFSTYCLILCAVVFLIFDFYLFYFMILFWGVSSIPEIRIFSQQRKRKKNLSLLSVCLCRSALYQSRSSSQLPRIPENWHQLQSIDRLCFSNQWIFLFFTKRVQKQLFVVVQLLYLGVNCVRGTFGLKKKLQCRILRNIRMNQIPLPGFVECLSIGGGVFIF